MKNKKSNKRRQSLHQQTFDFLVSIPVKIVKTVVEELKNIINDAPKVANDLKHKSLIALKSGYRKTEYALTLSKNWAMQFRIVQVAVNLIIKIVISIKGYSSKMSVAFKKFVVNEMPITAFVLIARVLPIGDWLKYEEQDEFGHTALSWAIENKDYVLLDRILKVASQEALYRYLFIKDSAGISPLHDSFLFYKDDTTVTKKIVKAIKPEKRIWVFNRIIIHKNPMVFNLVRGKKKSPHFQIVMDSLPEEDKPHFINQVDSQGYSPIMLMALDGASWEEIKSILDYFPKEQLLDYLNIINDRRDTFLVEAVSHPSNQYTRNIIELVPEKERDAFLSKHNQGIKALLYAKANYSCCWHQIPVLESYGIKVPEQYESFTSDKLQEQLPNIFEELDANAPYSAPTQAINNLPNEHSVRENFKSLHGGYPLDILNMNEKDEVTLIEVKAAYRKLMLFSHPDKNNGSGESTLKTGLINEAYAVYTKLEIRKKYYKANLF